MTRLLDGAHRIVWSILDFRTPLDRLCDVVSYQLPEEREPWCQLIPVRRRDLRRCQADQAVAAFQCVVEERELVVARERGKPQR